MWDLSSKTQDADQMLIYKDLIKLTKATPPQYRVVLNMHVIDGYNHLEIADIHENLSRHFQVKFIKGQGDPARKYKKN